MQKRANTATFVTAERWEYRGFTSNEWVNETRGHMLSDSVHRKCPETCTNGQEMSGCSGWRSGDGRGVGSDVKYMRILPEVVKCSKIVVTDVHFCDYTKNHGSGHFK